MVGHFLLLFGKYKCESLLLACWGGPLWTTYGVRLSNALINCVAVILGYVLSTLPKSLNLGLV